MSDLLRGVRNSGGGGLPSPIDRIVLTGFMGAGKSTVGRRLAQTLHWRFCDLDQEIASEAGLNVPEIFSRHGELHFRQLETRKLHELLDRRELVIALGGGSLESDSLFQELQSSPGTALLFLDAPLPELLQRCGRHGGSAARPLLSDPAAAEARYAKRLPLYEKAHLTVDTSGRPVGETVCRIQQALRHALS